MLSCRHGHKGLSGLPNFLLAVDEQGMPVILVDDRQGWNLPQQGGTRYGSNIWYGGSKYSAIYGLGGLISRVDHPWGDKNTQHQILDHSVGG